MYAQPTLDHSFGNVLQNWSDGYRAQWRAHGGVWLAVGALFALAYWFIGWCFGFVVANRSSALTALMGDATGPSQFALTLLFLAAFLATSVNAMAPSRAMDRAVHWLHRKVMENVVRMSASVIGMGLVGAIHYGLTRHGLGAALALVAVWFALMLAAGSMMLGIVHSFAGAPRGRSMGVLVFGATIAFCAVELRATSII